MPRMSWYEAEDLAAAVLGLDFEDEVDLSALEEALLERLEVTLEQFQAVAEALMPFTVPAQAALSGEWFQGFAKDGAFLVRRPFVALAEGGRHGGA